MGDQAALQEAIQRARQLADKMAQKAPVKRPPPSSDISGPVKVTLAYAKPEKTSDGSTDRLDRSQDRGHYDSRSRDHEGGRRSPPVERQERLLDRTSSNYHNESSSPPPPLPPSSRTQQQYQSQPSLLQSPASGGQQPSSMSNSNNRQSSGEEKIELIIPHAVIGLVIGKGGENIKRIQNESGATVRVDPNTVDEKGNKLCTITGTKQAVEEAHAQVSNVIENSTVNKRPRLQNEGADSYRMKIPASRTGAIIGKGGETIKSIKQQSGCDIELDKGAKETGRDESVFIIRGSSDKILKAKGLIEARLASRGRDGGREGGREGGRDHHIDHHSGRSGQKGVATGANAAPVAQFTDLPAAHTAYAAAGQQNSADVSAAWAAYIAQYSSLLNQTGAQPTSLPYAGQASLLGSASAVAPTVAPSLPNDQQVPQQAQQPLHNPADAGQSGQGQQDYSDAWIEFYLANGRPDYAEQIIQMKKAQQQKQQT